MRVRRLACLRAQVQAAVPHVGQACLLPRSPPRPLPNSPSFPPARHPYKQVVLSPTVFKQLPPGCLAKAAFLLHMGEHTLDDYSIAKRKRQQEAAAAAARRRAEGGRPGKPRTGRALGLPDLEHFDSAKESGGGSSGGAEAGEEPVEEGGEVPEESEEPEPIPLYQMLPHRLACRCGPTRYRTHALPWSVFPITACCLLPGRHPTHRTLHSVPLPDFPGYRI